MEPDIKKDKQRNKEIQTTNNRKIHPQIEKSKKDIKGTGKQNERKGYNSE